MNTTNQRTDGLWDLDDEEPLTRDNIFAILATSQDGNPVASFQAMATRGDRQSVCDNIDQLIVDAVEDALDGNPDSPLALPTLEALESDLDYASRQLALAATVVREELVRREEDV